MGSFNLTCAISKCTIIPSDKVRLFFLVSHTNKYQPNLREDSISMGFCCYPHEDFTVIGGIALEAVYDDYGRYTVTNEDSLQAKYILNYIKENYQENIPVQGVEYNKYHDCMSIAVESLDFNTVLEMIHKGRLFLKCNDNQKKPFVQMMAVHEKVYNVFLNRKYEKFVRDDSSSGYHYEEMNLEKYTKYIVDAISEHSKIIGGYVITPTVLQDLKHCTEYNLHGCINEYCEDNSLTHELPMWYNSLAESMFFDSSMFHYNFKYQPDVSSGQDGCVKEQAELHRSIANALDEIHSHHVELWDYEDD